MHRRLTRLTLTAVALGLASIAAGCGSSEDTPAGAKKMSFALTDAGCEPNTAKASAGPIAFQVQNEGTSEVTEFEVLEGDEVLGEKENLSEGLSGSFTLTLEPGRYTLYCPGGTDERGTLTIIGAGTSASGGGE
jgi:iron uptake system component EfeO